MSVEHQVAGNRETRTFSVATLPSLLRGSKRATAAEINQEFEHWSLVIGSLPLTTSEYGFANGWVTSAKKLWQRGDIHAAIFQLKQVARKLEL